MLWQALSRMVVVRLLLLVAIASTGPVAGPAWHTLDSQEHRAGLSIGSDVPATLASGALPYARAAHCAACAFGATLRAWSPVAAPLVFAPLPQGAALRQPSAAPVRSATASANADRAPPRLA